MSMIGWGDDHAIHRVYRAFAVSPTRIEILRFIFFRGDVSTSEIMVEVGLSRNGARVHLHALLAEGLLIKRHDTHPRGSGPITYWKPEVDQISDLLETLTKTLAP
jgi:predicted ArsR family transcriptional regulator